jgi:predicted lipoprotein with Yx(FWY)xxD motif
MKTNRAGTKHPARVGRLLAAGAALGAVSVPAWAGTPAGASQARITVSTMNTSSHGTVLVSGGKTVYTLQPSSTPCTSACLHVWPAVMLASGQKKPIAGHGVKQSNLGTVSVNGGHQVTYQGKRLYWYSGDSGPGQVNGNFTDEWGAWAAVVTTQPSSSSPSSSSPSSSSGSSSTSSNSGTGGASF